ncbi:P-loop containing nucleoside triphosphate hydrolase protein [Microdochium trichocladiopsis]|uniref:P-loop containing nucleoside triphosphate hydrolase protein n=1 Tax=Microdochium trichocladiopsis TaxID=1682393 RepID=A0A9P8XZS1_9PEZI|nr:P-loop containing nucleoside triphosphate hydrolase protein [Microdochium trichocladiopsis]KAH7025880.1 P-loop containing nucleoside triphosphate hydrolase protein [Microdochium trichocladiopsis]
MEDQVQRLVDKAWTRFQAVPPDQRLMIAISGIPGSGKTTLSQTVTNALNQKHQSQHPGSKPVAAFCPMDGYHLTREQLSAMPDPVNAHARRGAEFTFDGHAFLALVKALRARSTIYAPSFDHAVKDPKENDIPLRAHHRIVVFEGNYVCLNKEPWREAAGLMDERWFVEVDFAVARSRLVKRHVKAGIAADEIEAGKRADENDLVNGREIVDNKVDIDEVVYSREDAGWKHE